MQDWLLIPIEVFLAVAGARYLLFPHRAKDGAFRVFQAPSTLAAYRVAGAVLLAFGFLVAAGLGLGVPSVQTAEASISRNAPLLSPPAPLWMPQPAVAQMTPVNPQANRELCEGARETRDRLDPAKIRTAILDYVIERDGSVNDIEVAQSSGNEGLDWAIALCVATLRFQPPPNGEPMNIEWKTEAALNASVRSELSLAPIPDKLPRKRHHHR